VSAFAAARTASGHAAAPPSSVMKSRRVIDHLVGAGEQHRGDFEAKRTTIPIIFGAEDPVKLGLVAVLILRIGFARPAS
jgi:hypothetical protein